MTNTFGIELCEDVNHAHGPACRMACEICDVLFPPARLRDGVCGGCWEEHLADVQDFDVRVLVVGSKDGQAVEYGVHALACAPVVRAVGGQWRTLAPQCATYREACEALGRLVSGLDLQGAKFLVPADLRGL